MQMFRLFLIAVGATVLVLAIALVVFVAHAVIDGRIAGGVSVGYNTGMGYRLTGAYLAGLIDLAALLVVALVVYLHRRR
jgi:hypothetical protein